MERNEFRSTTDMTSLGLRSTPNHLAPPRIRGRRIILGHDGPALGCAWLARLGDKEMEPLLGRGID